MIYNLSEHIAPDILLTFLSIPEKLIVIDVHK